MKPNAPAEASAVEVVSQLCASQATVTADCNLVSMRVLNYENGSMKSIACYRSNISISPPIIGEIVLKSFGIIYPSLVYYKKKCGHFIDVGI